MIRERKVKGKKYHRARTFNIYLKDNGGENKISSKPVLAEENRDSRSNGKIEPVSQQVGGFLRANFSLASEPCSPAHL
jgi:hypothetical protein